MNSRSLWPSVLIAGAAMGLLGNLPLLNFVNCILCIWAWLGGALAVVLYRRYQKGQAAATTGQAAGLGAIAGVVGALIGFVVYFATASISAPLMDAVARALNVQSDLQLGTQNPGSALGGALFFMAVDLVLYPLFGALGGLVTATIINKPAAGQPASPA